MEPLRDEDGTKVNVIVGSSGAVDDQRTIEAVAQLGAEVGVIPSGSVLGRLESVRLRLPGSDWALCRPRHALRSGVSIRSRRIFIQLRHTVLIVRIELSYSMPVHCSSDIECLVLVRTRCIIVCSLPIMLHVIFNVDNKCITPIRLDHWAGICAIPHQDRTLVAVRRKGYILRDNPILETVCKSLEFSFISGAIFSTSLIAPVSGAMVV